MNKFYTVFERDHEPVNIVVAQNAKEAKSLGANKGNTENANYVEIRAIAVRGQNIYYQEYPEIHFKIKADETTLIETTREKGRVPWDDFINELEGRNLIQIDYELLKETLTKQKIKVPENLEQMTFRKVEELFQ